MADTVSGIRGWGNDCNMKQRKGGEGGGGIFTVSIVYDSHRESNEVLIQKEPQEKVRGVETHHLFWVSLSRASLIAV